MKSSAGGGIRNCIHPRLHMYIYEYLSIYLQSDLPLEHGDAVLLLDLQLLGLLDHVVENSKDNTAHLFFLSITN